MFTKRGCSINELVLLLTLSKHTNYDIYDCDISFETLRGLEALERVVLVMGNGNKELMDAFTQTNEWGRDLRQEENVGGINRC